MLKTSFATRTAALIALTLVLGACTTPGATAPGRTPSSSDEASDRLHDRKIQNFIDRADTKAAR